MKMNNKFFQDDVIKVALDSAKWQVICSMFPAEAEKVEDECHQQWLKKNSDCHSQREIMICLAGTSVISHQGVLYKCVPGTVVLFGSNEWHDSFYPSMTTGVTHLWLSPVKGAVFTTLISVTNGRYSRVNSEREPVLQFSEAANLLTSIWDELIASPVDLLPVEFIRQRIITAIANVVLELIALGYKNMGELSGNLKRQKQTIDLIKGSIKEVGGRRISLDQLAHMAGYSKYHFLRLFKQHAGCTVHSYIDQQRIRFTKEHLESGYRKNEIADLLGFSSPAVFSRWYRQHVKGDA